MLQAVAGETGDAEEVAALRMRADQRVVIERMNLVPARPCPLHPQRLEDGDVAGQERPEPIVELRQVGLGKRQIVGIRVALCRRPAGDELRPTGDAVGAEPRTARQHDQRRARQRVRAAQHEHCAPPRMHRQSDAGQPCDTASPRSGRVDEYIRR